MPKAAFFPHAQAKNTTFGSRRRWCGILFQKVGSDLDGVLGADRGAGAAGDAGILVERPPSGRAVDRQRPGGALLGADRTVGALGRDLNRLAVFTRLDDAGRRRGLRLGSGCGRGGLGRGLLRRGLEEGAGDDQILFLRRDHVEDDDNVSHRGKRGEGGHGDEHLHRDERGQSQQRSAEEHALVRRGGNDRLLAAELEEIIERLKHRRADALLHPGDDLAVDTGQQQTDQEAEQKARENEDMTSTRCR